MRKSLLALILFLACKSSLFASHIVGGEFELLHLQDFQYQLNMVMYFDEKFGNPGAKDGQVTVFIYRKADNVLMGQFNLFLNTDEPVAYSNEECNDGEIITSKLIYTNNINLPAEQYFDPKGYYIAWERCCRNYTITNIESAEPNTGGISAGQTFYLEFPPVIKNGIPFINSTPRLFAPLRDYACVNKFYYAYFGGKDDDGDSLVYTMVTPYSTVDTQNALPATPNSGPYPNVIWKNGFDLEHITGGNPDMRISNEGLLTVTPSTAGLYVFAVKCEEFRLGEKIGEMRRDFQMLVIDGDCDNETPVIRAREKGKGGFYVEGNELFFPFSAAERCVEILVTDVPSPGESSENVNIQAIPINFNAELEGISIDVSRNISLNSTLDTARFEICFPECPYVRDKAYKIGIVALDDACPQPALDTVIVTLNIQPPPNTTAYFAQSRNGARINNIAKTVETGVGGNYILDILGFDAEDSVTLEITPLGFDLEKVGMSFTNPIYTATDVQTTFSWNFDCNTESLDFSLGRDVPVTQGIRKAFDILLSIDDKDQCLYAEPKNVIMNLAIDFPDQTKPSVFETARPNNDYLKLNYTYGSLIDLNIKGRDLDNDDISLVGLAANFNFEEVGASFENMEGNGNPGITSKFLWDIPCQFETEIDSFRVQFFVEDLDACQLRNIDTLNVDLILSPPVNTSPEFFIRSLNDAEIINDSISVIVGATVEVNIRVLDVNGDLILLDILDRNSSDPYTFDSAEGVGSVQSTFSWLTECTDLTGPDLTRDLEITFIARDRNCYDPLSVIQKLKIHVIDVDAGEETILPPNIFTPNGDESNQFFGMYKINNDTNELENILPIDNCAGQFEQVFIYNRWGREVFSSTDRNFKWFGENVASGVYFYQISYTNKKYRGSVTVLY